jgi:hypothetical protein
VPEGVRGDPLEPLRVGLEGGGWVAGAATRDEQVVAGYGQALRPGVARALLLRVLEGPAGPRAGVEQHADHHQVEAGPGLGGGIELGDPLVEGGDAGDPPHVEVTPAAVVGDLQVRVSGPRDLDHPIGHRVELGLVHAEVNEGVFSGQLEHALAARPNGRW